MLLCFMPTAIRMTIYMDEDLQKRFKILATIQGDSMSSLITQWVSDYVEKNKDKLPEHLKEHDEAP